jgi:hypothetical protein
VVRVTAWIDAKPHRFKLVLLACAAAMAGVTYLASTPFR